MRADLGAAAGNAFAELRTVTPSPPSLPNAAGVFSASAGVDIGAGAQIGIGGAAQAGGGGGTVSMDEMHKFRMEIGGRVKVEQMKATGADIVIAPCANCKKQLRELIDYHKLPIQLKGLHDLLYEAIEL